MRIDDRPTGQPPPTGTEIEVSSGDVEGFIVIYHHYLKPVRSFLLARLGQVQEAEDLTAQVFEQVWLSLPNYQPGGSFAAWLFTIARRKLADYYRQPSRRRQAQLAPLDDLAEQLHDPAAGPEETFLLSEENRQLLAMLRSLRPAQQEVLSLRYLAGLSYAEIAQITNKREATVKMIAYRALEILRRRYSRDVF